MYEFEFVYVCVVLSNIFVHDKFDPCFWKSNTFSGSLTFNKKMDTQQSSATASVDPDRISIQYFEKGGANPQRDPIVVV